MVFLVHSCVVAVAVLVAVTSGYPHGSQPLQFHAPEDQLYEETARVPLSVVPSNDQHAVASHHDDHHYGRVQIKVYRGPTTHHGHEHFAPHGFWVKQPADDHHHHHH